MSKHKPATTATRTRKGAKSIITVTYPDGRTDTLGGKRAERAEAVLIAAYSGKPEGAFGCRASFTACQTEAQRMLTATTMRTRGKYGRPGSAIPIITADVAYAVRVIDGPAPEPTPRTAATVRAARKAEVAEAVRPSRRSVAPGTHEAHELTEALHAARIAGEEAAAAAERRDAAIVDAVQAGATFKAAGTAAGVSHEQARLVYVRWMRTATAS